VRPQRSTFVATHSMVKQPSDLLIPEAIWSSRSTSLSKIVMMAPAIGALDLASTSFPVKVIVEPAGTLQGGGWNVRRVLMGLAATGGFFR